MSPSTGVTVSKLGYGAMELRSRRLDSGDVDRLLNTVLDVGTRNPEHLAANIAAASRWALPTDVYAAAKARYAR